MVHQSLSDSSSVSGMPPTQLGRSVVSVSGARSFQATLSHPMTRWHQLPVHFASG